MSRLPLHALRGFVLAARHGNLTRAAAAAHLTVSALSHQMRGLEERLGRTLLVREPRGVSLTEDGRALLERIAPHLEAIEQALRPFPARREHVLTLSLLSSMANAWLMPRLPGFVAEHPDIELSLRSDVGLVNFEREREIDAALRFGPGRWPGVQAMHLFDDWLMPVASPALLARLGVDRDTPIERLPLLGDPGGRWEDWFCCHVPGSPLPRFVAHLDDSESLHRAAVEGLGVALGRMIMARPLIEAGHLVALGAQQLPAEWSHYLVWPARSDGHPALLRFREWLATQAEAYRSSALASASRGFLPSRDVLQCGDASTRNRIESAPEGE
ncbi:LysR substrate-binding domain-containing protein [Pseudomarimonas salicorniae]|uniref:LysR substrate-binding domain-containing protein n=1 Tax=Pseudomarimonas salicorniae TaxID=2933270 RepID=A0ABT0GCW3_9GAMM|nr:LysR substrate-binding domain-containing protein [Lysobacter sp. CAU 1642]MCK7592387.1 LysR substrate-binding domain-containing protein [Lysobacter sp. CAU 1642]